MDYLSAIEHVSNGYQTLFQVPFDKIKPEYVKAYSIDPEYKQQPLQFTWNAPNSIVLTNPVPKDWKIRIVRETVQASPLVDFTDVSVLSMSHLGLSQRQLLHLIQEISGMVQLNKLEADKVADELRQADQDMADGQVREDELAEAVAKLSVRDNEIQGAVNSVALALDDKADRIHAAQHGEEGFDPIKPEQIGALPDHWAKQYNPLPQYQLKYDGDEGAIKFFYYDPTTKKLTLRLEIEEDAVSGCFIFQNGYVILRDTIFEE